jgi:hypothetical protein
MTEQKRHLKEAIVHLNRAREALIVATNGIYAAWDVSVEEIERDFLDHSHTIAAKQAHIVEAIHEKLKGGYKRLFEEEIE